MSSRTGEPGSIEAALLAGITAESRALSAAIVGRVVTEGLAGDAWAAAPDPANLSVGRVVVRMRGARRHRAGAGRGALARALARHAAASIVIVADQPCRALLSKARALGCALVCLPIDPWPLLDGAVAVHASGDDDFALLALLAGVPLDCDQAGLASGWGASTDAPGVPSRGVRRSASEIAAAALIQGARYADPFAGGAIDAAAAVDVASEWRRIARLNRRIGCCTGMAFWKRRRMGAFFWTAGHAPPHRRTAAAVVLLAGGRDVAAWSSRLPAGLTDANVGVLRVEDGFIRSGGLGSDFRPPCSVVADTSGIYYDPSQPSDLETLLQTAEFPQSLRDRARKLIARLIRDGVTKYGAQAGETALMQTVRSGGGGLSGMRRLLVPGQVGDDLSVRLGGAGVTGNIDLLARVREANPAAWIIYKPHPDVDAGHRAGAVPDAQALRLANEVRRGVPMAAMIAATDEVHTLTSLAGFEALLRERRVVTYGQPFYAGWGLTDDQASLPRRTRRLSVDELAAGVLLLYPRYIDPVTGLWCPAEVLLDRLSQPALWRPGPLVRARQFQGRIFRSG